MSWATTHSRARVRSSLSKHVVTGIDGSLSWERREVLSQTSTRGQLLHIAKKARSKCHALSSLVTFAENTPKGAGQQRLNSDITMNVQAQRPRQNTTLHYETTITECGMHHFWIGIHHRLHSLIDHDWHMID